jgi:hypothetical protein
MQISYPFERPWGNVPHILWSKHFAKHTQQLLFVRMNLIDVTNGRMIELL